MREKIKYTTYGTCCKQINLELEDEIIKSVDFLGGCQGNLTGIKILVEGQNIHDVAKKLKGITCGAKPTSCPDQLATCLLSYIEQKIKTKA